MPLAGLNTETWATTKIKRDKARDAASDEGGTSADDDDGAGATRTVAKSTKM